MNTVLLCGSFDPFTSADMAMLKKYALRIYSRIIINVEQEPAVVPMFDALTRTKLICEALRAELSLTDLSKIEVITSTLSLPQLIREKRADVLMRFFIPGSDINYRLQEHAHEKHFENLQYKIDFRVVDARYADIMSAEMIKDLCRRSCFVMAEKFVPANIHQALVEKTLHSVWNSLFRTKTADFRWKQLTEAYTARAYHNLSHLGRIFDELKFYTEHSEEKVNVSKEMILAAFVHDYVCNGQDDDVTASADFIDEIAMELDSNISIERSKAMVMATAHINPSPIGEYALLSDLDLSILASKPADFRCYCDNIRREYADCDDDEYTAKRIDFLQKLLDMPRIFNTISFYLRYEYRARKNIVSEIKRLQG